MNYYFYPWDVTDGSAYYYILKVRPEIWMVEHHFGYPGIWST